MPSALVMFMLLSVNLTPARSETLMDDLILALEKLTLYLENNFQDFNLDGFVGFRFLTDWIPVILEKWAGDSQMHSKSQKLAKIERTVSSVIERSTDSLKQADLEYFSGLGPLLIKGFWKPSTPWTQTDPLLAYHQFKSCTFYTEELSDECLMNIFGTRKGNVTACTVPPFCRKMETYFGCSRYFLSHQLFYFMIAKRKGCSDPLFKNGTHDYEKIFCSSMMKVSQKIEEDGYPFREQDLFMENIMFCGLSGYSDFLKSKWLKQILAWQEPDTGCFGKTGLLNYLSLKNDQEKHHSHRRVKRREHHLTDGCLCHMTSIAAGALAAFLNL
ncbi:UPF0764 protein C16orf89 homolog [Lissotriton helveticus]